MRVFAIWAMLTGAPAAADPLHLICLGEGTANRLAQTYASAADSRGNQAWAQVVARRVVPFDDQVNIDLNEQDVGTVRMPRAMLPPLHGGSDGRFQINGIRRTETEITGTVQVNLLNQPKLRLDCVSGRISINGRSGDYAGECQAYEPATVQRRF